MMKFPVLHPNGRPVDRLASPAGWRIAIRAAILTVCATTSVAWAQSEPGSAQDPAAQAEAGESAPAQRGVSEWLREAAEAYYAEDHVRWVSALENLHRLRPLNYDFMRQLVMGYALTERTSNAFEMMLRMQRQGLAADWDSVDEVKSLRQYPLYGHLRDLMRDAGSPGGAAVTAFSIPPEHPMPEALAHDPGSGRIFVGTVHDGRILARIPGEREFEVFADSAEVDGLTAVFDLLVDDQRGHLWAATGAISQYRRARTQDIGRTALIQFDLETGDKIGEYRVVPDGQPHLLGAMAMASDGTIYASDSFSPEIFRLTPGAERPVSIGGHPMLTGLRGVALSPDDQRLYVADYDLGVFFFALGEEVRLYSLGVPETLNLGGVDGLYTWSDDLVVIQNGVSPQRILRLELDDSGTRVENIATLARALPEFDTPTYGTVAGDDLLFLAASHWPRVDGKGRPVDPPLPEIPVLRASISDAEEIVVGQEMIDRIKTGESPDSGGDD